MLSGFLNPGGGRGSSKPRSSSNSRPATPDALSTEYLTNEAQISAGERVSPELGELNKGLEVLTTVFPDVQIEVFREMLSSFDAESRLAVIANALLKDRAQHVKGRSKVKDPQVAKNADGPAVTIPVRERFRSSEYKNAARVLAQREFKGLSTSTIDAVLAESNYYYLDARRTLVDLSLKSWKFTISSIIFRRKPVTSKEAETHPLVTWRSTGSGSIQPSLRSTGSYELDRELFEELILPLQRQKTVTQQDKDRAVAVALNNKEAEECDALHECMCCFAEGAFEEFTTCNREGHLVCFRCVQHSIREAVFGQGWHRSIDKNTGTLRCPAVSSQECGGCIPSEHIYRAMQEEKNGAEVLHKLDQRLAEHNILATNLPLIRCPFCDYIEIDDVYVPPQQGSLKVRASNIPNVILILLCVAMTPFVLPALLFITVSFIVLNTRNPFSQSAWKHWAAAKSRHQRKKRGLKFSCQNLACGVTSCLSCSKAWDDIHVCHESSLMALRTAVEQAMSLAVKRVCPRCNTSFVKSIGCNKLMCPCGYKMCYVCRKDIGPEGYQHFCQHFRPEGDGRQCLECSKCNLWEKEDTEAVLRQAKAEAELRWKETEGRDLSGTERNYLETGVASKRVTPALEDLITRGRLPTFSEVCDWIIENLFT